MGKIYIVAGHGAGDPGAIGCGYKEADLTRKMANDIYNRMKDKNIVLYPTSRDLYKSKDYNFFTNADYVLEIHFNSAANSSANGTELLIKQGYQPDSSDKAIYNAVAPFFAKRGVKVSSALANMNQFAKRGIGYSLLEVCFICNSKDMTTFNQNYNKIIDNLVKALGGKGSTTDVVINQADEWKLQNGRWWYRHADGGYTIKNWEMINGKWYYFDKEGWMVTGWKTINRKWYLLSKYGDMKKGWEQVNGRWYYLDPTNGDMKTGWVQVGGKWYFLNPNGDMRTGWLYDKEKWYWLKPYGDMATNEVLRINNKDYVFAKSGYMRKTADMEDGKLD